MSILTVVIPAYNEEGGIADIAKRVLAVKKPLQAVGVENLELIVVDDGSKDKTADIASQIEGVTLIKHAKNKNYGGALKTGFANAKGDLVGFLDADGTYPPEYFPQLCQAIFKGADLVVGSRMAGSDSKMPATRRLGNFLFANLLSILGRQKITDSASGMRVFRKDILERIYPLPNGLNLTPVMSTRALHEEVKMVEVPIPYSERVGRSKLSVVRDGSVFLQSIVWTVMTYNPVRIMGLIGLSGVLLAVLVLLGLVIARLSGVTTLGTWGIAALYWALVSLVAGISIFALGATFNYLVSLFYKAPIRQGLFGKPVFNPPLETHFGWMGAVSLVGGVILALVSLVLSTQGWDVSRVWLYLLGSAMLILVGIQLIIYWLLMHVLVELSQREDLAKKDMNGF
jgi:glycosyltransferase involved in cell wall biosynthesis